MKPRSPQRPSSKCCLKKARLAIKKLRPKNRGIRRLCPPRRKMSLDSTFTMWGRCPTPRAIIPPSPLINRSAVLRTSSVGPVAQWLEPSAHNRLVAGSSPAGPTILLHVCSEAFYVYAFPFKLADGNASLPSTAASTAQRVRPRTAWTSSKISSPRYGHGMVESASFSSRNNAIRMWSNALWQTR